MSNTAIPNATQSRHEQASAFLEGRTRRRRHRDIVTPEGVALPFELAQAGERMTAFVIDMVFAIVATLLFYFGLIVGIFSALGLEGEVSFGIAMSIIIFVAFLVRNFYFTYFELAWQGATPGKRIVGIRVVDRKGGPLIPSAIVARNLTREFEIFLPLGLMTSLEAGTGAWEKLSLLIWALLISALPLFNRDRMRGGDMIAGTIVIALPKRVLLGDLVESTAHFTFREEQLAVYGTFELQILEELLRRPNAPAAQSARRDVAEKIRQKIGWTDAIPDSAVDRFLTDFYAAQRGHLERGQLYGRYRADKNAAAG